MAQVSEWMIPEVWVPVLGYEKLYKVSNLGRVQGPRRILKPVSRSSVSRSDYPSVVLCGGDRQITHNVHRLVARAFFGEPKGECVQVNHIDCNKHNNRLDNLEWVTPQGNARHASQHGRYSDKRGELNNSAKLAREQVLEIRQRCAEGNETQAQIAAAYGVARTTISSIHSRINWSDI